MTAGLPSMMALIAIATVGLVAMLFWLGMRRERRTLANRFADRAALDFDVFFQRYYSGKIDRTKVEELLRHVADELSLPAEKLLPSDKFDVELRPARGWELDSGKGILLVELDKLARLKGSQVDLQAISTLDDYLNAMAKVY